MKLLLTSAGLSHKVIGRSLENLVAKPASDTKVAFIPTAANVESGNHHWMVRQFVDLWQYGFQWIDVVDPSAADVDWRNRLREVDVLYVSGGNTFYLLDQVRKTGFDTWLRENIDKKVYVGGSASTILMTPTIAVAGLEPGDDNLPKLTDLTGLGYVDFEVEPHCDAARIKAVKAYADTSPNSVYAIDDLTAIQVVDGAVSVVSAGSWRLYDT
ncbi:MAG TPA: Type 1 glutamine amidotransferase-like domain-containing protein [Verrucomicrobiae bacterium]|nr:Type 1 glutamine amidotransferase-like domain-containing protein [Verrucomicrobiae bacterium]